MNGIMMHIFTHSLCFLMSISTNTVCFVSQTSHNALQPSVSEGRCGVYTVIVFDGVNKTKNI